MKTRYTAIVALMFALTASASTNGVPNMGIPPMDSVIASYPWIGRLLMWLGVATTLSGFVGRWLERKIADAVNRIAESKDIDDDEYLRILFSKPWYKFVSFLSGFTPFRLKTLSDLERAIKLQQEEVVDALNEPTKP